MADPAQYRAARDLCRAESPDLFFAANFLPKAQRHDIYILRAACATLRGIIEPPAPKEANEGCTTCGTETPQQRKAVCAAVLDALYDGLRTGKPELDGFKEVVDRCKVPRGLFDAMVDGMATQANLRVYATWNRLRQVCGQAAGSAALIALRVLMKNKDEPIPALVEQQVAAWASAIRLTMAFCELKADLANGRLMLPLEDLVKFGLDRKEVEDFMRAGTSGGDSGGSGGGGDSRWVELMRMEAGRVRNLYGGGTRVFSDESIHLSPAGRRAMAVYGETYLGLLDRLERDGFDPFREGRGSGERITVWNRLARLPGVMKVVGRGK